MADIDLSTLGSVIKTAYEAEADTNAVTDAEKTVIGNTSGTNTGDNAVNTSSATAAQGSTADSALQPVTTTKGDLDAFSTARARFGIGTDTHVLTVDSTQPFGFKWAAPTGGGAFSADVETQITPSTAVVLNAASGVEKALSVPMTVNQTSTAGYNAIHVNVTETALGSGENNLMDLQVGGVSQAKIDNNGKLTLDPAGTFGTGTGLWFGDGDTGLYLSADNILKLNIFGVEVCEITKSYLKSSQDGFNGPRLGLGSLGSTEPGFSFSGDANTGIGLAAIDQLSLIAGGVEAVRCTEAAGAIVNDLTGVATLITGHTVATLPTPAVGMIARVTDATTPAIGSTVSGGGAAYALCNYNGAAWTVIGI